MARKIKKKPRCGAPVFSNNSLKISIPLTRLSSATLKNFTKTQTSTITTLDSSKENDSTKQEKIPVLKIKKSNIVDLSTPATSLESDVELLLNFGNTAIQNSINSLISKEVSSNIEKTKDTVNETLTKPTKTDSIRTVSDVIIIDDVEDEIPAIETKQKPLNDKIIKNLTGVQQNSVAPVSVNTLPERSHEKNVAEIKSTIHIEQKKNAEKEDKATQTDTVLVLGNEVVEQLFCYDKLLSKESKLSETTMSQKKSNTVDYNGENDLNNNNGDQSNLQNEVTITEIIDITTEPDNDIPEDVINKLIDQSEQNKALINKICEPQQKNLQLQLENHRKLADIMLTKLANQEFETVRENMKDLFIKPSQSKTIETQTENPFLSLPIQGPYDIANNNDIPNNFVDYTTLINQQQYDTNKLDNHQVSALEQHQKYQYNRMMVSPLEVTHNWNPSMTAQRQVAPNYAYVEPTAPSCLPAFPQVSYASLSSQTGGTHNSTQEKGIKRNRNVRNVVRGANPLHATTGPTKQNNKYKLLMQQQKLREMAAQQRAWQMQNSNYPYTVWGNNFRPKN